MGAGSCGAYIGALSGTRIPVENGQLHVSLPANSGEIWLPETGDPASLADTEPVALCMDDAAGNVAGKNTSGAQTGAPQAADSKPTSGEPGGNAPGRDAEQAAGNANAPADNADADNANAPADNTDADNANTPADNADAGNANTPADNADADALRDAFEQGKIAGIQEAILAIMEKNGPVTDQMRRDVTDNVYHDSLINWVKSFR